MDAMKILFDTKPSDPIKEPGYHEAIDAVIAAEQEILQTYPEIQQLLEAYQSAQLEVLEHMAYHEFKQGVRLGMKLLCEGLKEDESQ